MDIKLYFNALDTSVSSYATSNKMVKNYIIDILSLYLIWLEETFLFQITIIIFSNSNVYGVTLYTYNEKKIQQNLVFFLVLGQLLTSHLLGKRILHKEKNHFTPFNIFVLPEVTLEWNNGNQTHFAIIVQTQMA